MTVEQFVAVFITIAGAVLSLVASRYWLQARSSAHWPSVPGVLEEGSVEVHQNARRAGKYTDYDITVLYRYTVQGQTFHSTCRGF